MTPFWRIIPAESSTAKKLTFGAKFLKEQQTKEGLQFQLVGKRKDL